MPSEPPASSSALTARITAIDAAILTPVKMNGDALRRWTRSADLQPAETEHAGGVGGDRIDASGCRRSC